MATEGEIGQISWVEAELRKILGETSQAMPSSMPTLLGREGRTYENSWNPEDTTWARAEVDLGIFYQPGDVSILNVCVESLRVVGKGKAPSSMEIAEELLHGGYYKEALEVTKGKISEGELKTLRQRIDGRGWRFRANHVVSGGRRGSLAGFA